MEKKATGHIEMILSFVIFIFFVFFLLMYVQPYKETSLADSVILGLKDKFENQNSINYTKIFLRVNELNEGVNCFSVNLGNYDGNSIVKKTDGVDVSSLYSGSQLSVSSGISRYYVFISGEFSDASSFSCPEGILESTKYSIGSIETKKVISSKSLGILKTRFESGDSNLRSELGVPATLDFSIQTSDNSFVLDKQIPEKVEVISKTYSFLVLSKMHLSSSR